jgi:hypothetical protein
MNGMDVSVSPNASTNASMPKRFRNWSTMDDAVGAAYTHRSSFSASSGRAGCFQTKSIITPRKLVAVTPDSRTWSIHRLALNFRRSTNRAPATRAG